PLIALTQKAVPFQWEEPQFKAFETLKTLMCARPVLRQPDYTRPFCLSTDASAYGVGAVLSQEGELNPRTKKPTQHPIAYYSATFSPTERNYDIYERELLAIMKALAHWRPHLAGTRDPVTVLTDHANLTYWKEPRKVNRRVARWFAERLAYHLRIQHVPGKIHAAADMLSRPPGQDEGKDDNSNLVLLPQSTFARVGEVDVAELEKRFILKDLANTQEAYDETMQRWQSKYGTTQQEVTNQEGTFKVWTKEDQYVIPPDLHLQRLLMREIHDTVTAGHPGRDETLRAAKLVYWWPLMDKWIVDYVAGCAVCQQTKIRTHQRRV